MDIIKAPFTEDQVKNLNAWQKIGIVHEYTCPRNHSDGRALIATTEGWECPVCEYKQNWAHNVNVRELVESWNASELGKIKPVVMPGELL